MQDKAYYAIAEGFASRQQDIIFMQWDWLKRSVDSQTGEILFKINYQRLKTVGVVVPEDQIISGKGKIQAIDNYIALFEPQDKNGRFFRKLNQNGRTGKISPTNSPLGKNWFAKSGVRVATALGLPDTKLYTGHYVRRKTAIRLADEGCSLPQIKKVTGHRSDKVVQGVNIVLTILLICNYYLT